MRLTAALGAVRADPDDNELMALVQGGDHDAFARLYDRYADRAYRVARSVSTDDGRAQDAVQEGFASIWKARAAYRPERPTAAAWILTLVRHRAIDLRRRDLTQKTRHVADDVFEGHAAPDNVAAEVADQMESSDIRALLNRLPESQSVVITLAFYGELTHTEIAEQLGLPIGTVKGRMRLGMQKLRVELESPHA